MVEPQLLCAQNIQNMYELTTCNPQTIRSEGGIKINNGIKKIKKKNNNFHTTDTN